LEIFRSVVAKYSNRASPLLLLPVLPQHRLYGITPYDQRIIIMWAIINKTHHFFGGWKVCRIIGKIDWAKYHFSLFSIQHHVDLYCCYVSACKMSQHSSLYSWSWNYAASRFLTISVTKMRPLLITAERTSSEVGIPPHRTFASLG